MSLREEPLIVATSDIHSPRYLAIWRDALLEVCDSRRSFVLMIAGDIVDRGRAEAAELVERVLRECKSATKIVGVFGNDDFVETREAIRAATPSVLWLDDEVASVELGGLRLDVLGSTGILDELTNWQSRNAPWLAEVYSKRLEMLRDFSLAPRRVGTFRVVLFHYPPTTKTLIGEARWAWPQMGSRAAEKVISDGEVDIVVHGHAHKGKVPVARIGKAVVYNVSFPAIGGVREIVLRRQTTLEQLEEGEN
ncbi:MAG: metallophosphoesterase [Fervidicoccaceae archaeon]